MASQVRLRDMLPGQTAKRILVIGGGGRENALGWALARCSGVEQVWIAPGNGGTTALVGCHQLAIAENDHAGLLAAAQRHQIELVVVGPEAPLATGLADSLRQSGLAVFGPGADGAQLEASKQWAKALMVDAGIPTARHWSASSLDEALAVLNAEGAPLVVKADGLAAGKGVTVAATVAETKAAIEELFSGRFGAAGSCVVLEEILEGPEVSVFALCDGNDMVLLPPAQDHKRIGEGDTGPNTGGMGAYLPVSTCTPELVACVRETIILPMLAAMRAEGCAFTGLLYAGLMLNKDGPKVVEFNCRFGDPETQAVLPMMASSLLAPMQAIAEGRSIASLPPLQWKDGAAITTVVAAEGYPGTARSGDVVTLPAAETGVTVFHAGTARNAAGELVTAGGRVLAVTAIAPTLADAQAKSHSYAERVQFTGRQLRRDIGWRELARVP